MDLSKTKNVEEVRQDCRLMSIPYPSEIIPSSGLKRFNDNHDYNDNRKNRRNFIYPAKEGL